MCRVISIIVDAKKYATTVNVIWTPSIKIMRPPLSDTYDDYLLKETPKLFHLSIIAESYYSLRPDRDDTFLGRHEIVGVIG